METATVIPRRILVVDDEPLVCLSLKMLLAAEGHRVVTASGAEEAWALLCGEQFDLVIADYAMPLVKGDQLASRIKKRWRDLPVMVITVYAEIFEMAPTPATWADAFVSKPFRLEDLRQAIERVTRLNAAVGVESL